MPLFTTTEVMYRQCFLASLCVTFLLVWPPLVVAVEVGDTVRVRDGGSFRTGTIVGTLGNAYRVRYDDGHMPTEELLDERHFVSNAEVEREQQMERDGRFYQSIGRALGLAFAVASLLLIALWCRMQRNRQSVDGPEVEVDDAEVVERQL